MVSFNHMVKSITYDLNLIFHALSNSTRRAILRDISRREKTIKEITKPYKMSLPAVSKHLKVLGRAHLIKRRKEGSFHIIKLNAKGLKSAEQWLSYYQKFWDHRLDALERLLEEGEE